MNNCKFFGKQDEAPKEWWHDPDSKCKKCKYYNDCVHYTMVGFGEYVKKELKLGKEKKNDRKQR